MAKLLTLDAIQLKILKIVAELLSLESVLKFYPYGSSNSWNIDPRFLPVYSGSLKRDSFLGDAVGLRQGGISNGSFNLLSTLNMCTIRI